MPIRRPQLSKLIISAALSGLFAAALVFSTAVPAAAADINGCSANVQNPHWSNGAGGHISKANWSCTRVPTLISLDPIGGYGYYLWLCPSKPPKSESYLSANCTVKGENYEDINATSTRAYTRYVPPASQPGAHGTGWYIACATWQTRGPGGVGGLRVTFSNAVHLTG